MNNEQLSMEIAMNFYEEKNVEVFLAEAKEKGVIVEIYNEKKDEYVDYIVGGVVHVVRFEKPGKKATVTIRPIL